MEIRERSRCEWGYFCEERYRIGTDVNQSLMRLKGMIQNVGQPFDVLVKIQVI